MSWRATLALAGGIALLAASPAPAQADWRALCADPQGWKALDDCAAAVRAVPENLEAQRRLAWLLLSNNREPRALELFGRLAVLEQDNPEAQFDYAAALATVWDYQAAVLPITRAIRLKGDEPRYYRLAAVIYEQLARSDEAFVFHLRLARLGDRIAMYDLASDYAQGRGTEADDAAALHWFEAAAAQDHVGAMEQLAEAYGSGGLGLARDPARAEHWQQRAAAARAGATAD